LERLDEGYSRLSNLLNFNVPDEGYYIPYEGYSRLFNLLNFNVPDEGYSRLSNLLNS
jgi:hypothetical protein